MKTKDLIEIAQLHTLGLLDEADAAEFETAFAAAAPGVQAQVRREQARLAQMDAVLPEVDPRPELRGLVIEAVRREATVARASESTIRHEAGRQGAGRVPAIISGRRVSRLWRTAAVSFAAMALVLGAFTVYVKIAQNALQHKLENDAFADSVAKNIGPQFANDVLFGDGTRYVFTNTDPKFAYRASVIVSPRSDRAVLFYNLPSNNSEIYQLVQVDDEGRQIGQPIIKEFTSPGGIQGEPIKVTPGAAMRLAIRAGVRVADGSVQWTVVATTRIG